MAIETVKYHNDLNSVSFKGFNEKELDLFFAICYKAKEKGTDIIEFDFSELNKIISIENNANRLKNYVVSLNKKLLSLNYTVVTKSKIDSFVFFTRLSSNFDTGKIEVVINEPFKHLLNDLFVTYTKFDLLDFVELKSIYSKNLFRLLKQWESIKAKQFEIEDFKYILGIPINYEMRDINKRVLKPIMEELPNHFSNLKLEKIKTGKKVTSLKFTWESNSKKIEAKKTDEVIDIIEISETLNNAIEKAKKNRFIKKLLTLHNIEKLLKTFAENDLVKGLNWAYREIRQDVTSFNYLIKTIETGIEKKEKKIVVKIAEEKIDTFDKYFEEIPLNFDKKELEKITRLDYEKLYQEYLKKHNISNLKTVRKGFDISNKNRYKIIEERQTQEEEKAKALKNDFTDSKKTEIDLIIEKYNISENMIKTGMEMGFSKEETVKLLESNYKEQEQEHKEFLIEKKIYPIDEIEEHKLLSKHGKKLVGGALIARLTKIAKELKKDIQLEDGRIILA